ncbi:PLDc N-terminal domain-containing protein [Fulvivirga ligni]|uniref:PLDc N-terminal domain-containing protein n=1 Tax=Fulvivirga ligni TaxID=2904246 RepID=UPI001F1DC9C5|nr:PLD nuclease N-terminal domain-containing protein [Fulvivirga ligni]UII20535.1 PLD nuclease N-terminal domain-containing protein [Fulvivirga ligni]
MKSMLILGMIGSWELILILFVLMPGIFALWALIDVVKSEFTNSNNKLVWVLLIIFLPLLGSILYLTIGRSQKLKV